MNSISSSSSPASSSSQPLDARAAETLPAAARKVLKLLRHLPHGELHLQQPDGTWTTCRAHESKRDVNPSLHGVMQVRDGAMFERVLRSGDIGLAESYFDAQWDTPDLAALLRLALINRAHIESIFYGSWWGRLAYRLRHLRQRNSRSGSQRNIHAHYDLGNDFYRLWLDPSMSYSAAWFEGRDPTGIDLREAQNAKVRRALREARVQPGQRLLEIGCGWGGLAEIAAREFGACVTGITLSKEQLAWGQRRIRDAGLEEQVDLQYLDYRDLPALYEKAPFDAIVSIEMFEAVGEAYWPGFFDTLNRCLKPGGHACLQSITIRDELFDRYRRSTDFIQQYIFPGGMLPSPSAFEQQARRAGLNPQERLAFGPDYAETLRRWRDAFLREQHAVQSLGFDARFQRIWRFYLGYCEAAFDAGSTDVMQFTLRKPSV